MVLADGSVVTTSADERPELLELARVGLGALGVITAITLQCVPRFALHVVDEPMPLDRVLDEVDDLVETNDHFEFFWFPYTDTALTRRFQRLAGRCGAGAGGSAGALVRRGGGQQRRLGRAPAGRPGVRRVRAASQPDRHRSAEPSASTPTCPTACSRHDATCGSTRASMRSRAGSFATCSASSCSPGRTRPSGGLPLRVPVRGRRRHPPGPDVPRPSAYIAFHQYRFDAAPAVLRPGGGRLRRGRRPAALGQDAPPGRRRAERRGTRGTPTSSRCATSSTRRGVFANDYLDRVLGAPIGAPR